MLPSSSAMTETRLRVLVVEDEPSTRAVVRRQLEALGCDVVAFATGEEAVRAISGGLRVELLLADVQLSGMNGIATAHAIASVSPQTRIAFMSGAAPPPALKLTDAPFLRKPFSVSALAAALQEAMGRQH